MCHTASSVCPLPTYYFQPSHPPPTLPPPPCLRPVVEGDSSGGLLLAEEGWGLHLGVAEAQVLVEIVQAIDKVTYMTAEHLKVEGEGSCFGFKEILSEGTVYP